MSYQHGVYISELATSVLPPASVDSAIPFIVGTAPVGMTDVTNVNRPVLCSSWAEAVAAFGYVPPKANAVTGLAEYEYSICEFIRSQFSLFGVGPCVIVNVLDPDTHQAASSVTSVTIGANGIGVYPVTGVLKSTVALTSGEDEDEVTYVEGTDYALGFDGDGQLVITSLTDGSGDFKLPIGEAITIACQVTDPSAVDAADIIGGVDVSGAKKGFELVGDVYPRFGVVPGVLIAPGYSEDAAVAAVMAAKCRAINGIFNAVCVIDVPTSSVTQYTGVKTWKDGNNVTDPSQICCWPLLSLSGTVYHMSTQLAGLMGLTDAENGSVPYVSPSNKSFKCTSTVLASGSEVWLDNQNASYLNGQGVVTAQNFIGGWKCWGNRTACYPANTDAKDAFIPIRRMFDWIGNTLATTFWQRIDYPLSKRQVETIVDSANIWLNGLAAREYILGGRVEFNESENPETDLLDGRSTFHVYITPPAPNREIEFVLEYDVSYLATLFA